MSESKKPVTETTLKTLRDHGSESVYRTLLDDVKAAFDARDKAYAKMVSASVPKDDRDKSIVKYEAAIVQAFNILADWCGDNKDYDREAALRWLAVQGKRPYTQTPELNQCAWFDAGAVAANLGDVTSDVPADLFAKLTGKPVANHKLYDSLEECLDDTVRAFHAAVESGWKSE